MSGNGSSRPSQTPERSFGAAPGHFWSTASQQRPHCPGQRVPLSISPAASLPPTATPRGGETPPASHRCPFPCFPQLFQAAPPSPPVPSCTDESHRSTSRQANPNIHSARDAAGGQLHARVIPSVISFFQGAAAAKGAAGGANYSAPRPHSRAHQQKNPSLPCRVSSDRP